MSPARSPGADRAQRPSDTPVRQDALPSRDVLTASVVSAAFGIAWALFGASGLPAGAQAAVRGLGIVIGVVIIVRAMRLRRSAPVPAMPGFRSRQYRAVVAAEVAAIIAGLLALPLTGNGKYLAAWFDLAWPEPAVYEAGQQAAGVQVVVADDVRHHITHPPPGAQRGRLPLLQRQPRQLAKLIEDF